MAHISPSLPNLLNLTYGKPKVTSVGAVQTSCLAWEAVTTHTILENQPNRIFKVTSWYQISSGSENEDQGKA
jgi:hypothetical protein